MVGKNGGLGDDARLIDIGRREHRLKLLTQTRLIGGSRLGSGRFDPRDE